MSGFYLVTANFSGRVLSRQYFVPNTKAARSAAVADGASAVYKIRASGKDSWLTQEYMGRDYAIGIMSSIRFQVEAGASPAVALIRTIDSETNPKRRARLQPAVEVITRGGTIADAIRAMNLFDNTTYAILTAGEHVGAGQAISNAILYLQDRRSAWKEIMAAVVILGSEISTALSVPPTIHYWAVPWLRDHLPKTDPVKLADYSARLESAITANMVWMTISFAATAILVGILVAWLANPRFRDWFTSRVLIRIPLLRSWFLNDSMARTTKMFASMLKGGVRIPDAVDTLCRTTKNPVIAGFWQAVQKTIEQGRPLSAAMVAGGLLYHSEQIVIATAKGADQLGTVFEAMTEDRQWRAKMAAMRLLRASIGLTIAYIGFTIINVMDLYELFSEGLDLSMATTLGNY